MERVVGLDGLDGLLRESDYGVLTLALNPTSRGLLGAQELAVLKDVSVLVNVARGDVIERRR